MKYRSEIDGLRALAVVPVILFHAGLKAFSGGFVGVDVFFVISGYLITTILLNDLQAGKFSLLHFYERRARRILPALFVVMLACLPFAWFWLLPQDMKSFAQSLVAVSVFASNILFWRTSGYFDTATELKPLIHTWSLSVEEQYYVLFPLFLLFAWRLGQRRIAGLLAIIAVISLACAQWGAFNKPDATFYLLPTRAWELLIGALIAFYYTEHNIKKHKHSHAEAGSALGFALIAYSIFYFSEQTPFPSLYALAPTIGAALIIVFATHKTLVGKLLGSKPFVAIGLISYSAYLWHQPMFAFARHRSLDEPSAWLMCVLAIASLPLAYLTWRFVERPFRNRHTFNRTQVFAFALIGSVTFGGVGMVGHFSNGITKRLPTNALRVIEGQSARNPNSCMSGPNNQIDPSKACVLGVDTQVIGALIGDSHAGALAFSLGNQLQKVDKGLLDLTSNGCSPIFDVYTTYTGSECVSKNYRNFEYIKSDSNLSFVVILGRWSSALTGEPFDNQEGGAEPRYPYIRMISDNGKTSPVPKGDTKIAGQKIIETIAAYLATHKTIILVYPIPEAGWNVPVRQVKDAMFSATEIGSPEYLSTSFDVYRSRHAETIRDLDSIGDHPNLIRVRPDKILCDTYVPKRCITQLNGVPLYYDDDHLNTFGANLLTKSIAEYVSLRALK